MKTIISVDNGTSGSIAIFHGDEVLFFKTPIKKELSYTKIKKYITRINFNRLHEMLSEFKNINVLAVLERPLVNPGLFTATISAMRSIEATQIILDCLNIPYIFEDSKAWQKEMLPKGLKGKELKTASLDIGNRLFPQFRDIKPKHPDRDSLLMGEYARRKYG